MVERSDSKHAPLEHLDALDRATSPRSTFDAMLCRLVLRKPTSGRTGKRDGRRRAMIEALDGRATWIQIRHWRRGTNRVPDWATETVSRKLADRAALDARHAALARSA